MLFEKIESEGLAQYSYMIGDGYEAVVIDPRRDCQVYIELAVNAGMQISHILETHRHEDFAVGSLVLANWSGAQIWHADPQLPYKYGTAVNEGQEWRIGSLVIRALHTPGHTEGSRSYVLYTQNGVPWFVFTGDVLFTGEVGRVDFLGMDHAPVMAGLLYDSIFNSLLPLGDGVILCPAHGYGSACGSSIADRPVSTLGIERQLNPRLQFTNRDAFISEVAKKLPKPDYFSKMEVWNLEGPPPTKGLAGLKAFSPHQFNAKMRDAVIVDLRTIEAFAGGHIPGALSIETGNLPSYVGWFVDTEAIVLFVGETEAVKKAAVYLSRQGYDNILGYLSGGMYDWTVSNLPVTKTKLISPSELLSLKNEIPDIHLIDVRSPEEYSSGALPGSRNIPVKGFNKHMDEVQTDGTVVLYCAGGPRSVAATSALQRFGHSSVVMLRGGIYACRQQGILIQ